MNNIERGRALQEIEDALKSIRNQYSGLAQGPEIVSMWENLISLATILKDLANQQELVQELAGTYGFVAKQDAGTPKYTLTYVSRVLSRAEAIRYRNLFAAEGLFDFRVSYGQNGVISSFDDGLDLLADMKLRWGAVWNIWLSPTQIYHFKPNSKQPVIPETVAKGLSDQLRSLYPMANCAVWYGEKSDLVIRAS